MTGKSNAAAGNTMPDAWLTNPLVVDAGVAACMEDVDAIIAGNQPQLGQ